MSDDLIVCRCEEVTLRELRTILAQGVATPHGLKLFSRAGMGMCQGRTCRALVEALARSAQSAEPVSVRPAVRPTAYRMPLRPVPIADIATLDNNEGQP